MGRPPGLPHKPMEQTFQPAHPHTCTQPVQPTDLPPARGTGFPACPPPTSSQPVQPTDLPPARGAGLLACPPPHMHPTCPTNRPSTSPWGRLSSLSTPTLTANLSSLQTSHQPAGQASWPAHPHTCPTPRQQPNGQAWRPAPLTHWSLADTRGWLQLGHWTGSKPCPTDYSPCSLAQTAASTREASPSLARTLET